MGRIPKSHEKKDREEWAARWKIQEKFDSTSGCAKTDSF